MQRNGHVSYEDAVGQSKRRAGHVEPPDDLVPLIRQALDAGVAQYQEAGRLLLEAKKRLKHGDFKPWVTEHFSLSYSTAKAYMRVAQLPPEKVTTATFRELREGPESRRNQRTVTTEPTGVAQARYEIMLKIIELGYGAFVADDKIMAIVDDAKATLLKAVERFKPVVEVAA